MIVLQMLFDSEHLENYIRRKIHQFSSNVQIAENISQALQSPEAERIIDEKLDHLYSQPEAYYLQSVGMSRERVKPMIRPAVVSLCAESAPYVLDLMHHSNVEQVSTNCTCVGVTIRGRKLSLVPIENEHFTEKTCTCMYCLKSIIRTMTHLQVSHKSFVDGFQISNSLKIFLESLVKLCI